MKKLAIITTHPIQYNAPWFQLLAQRKQIDLKVFYTWSQTRVKVEDVTFGRSIQWDIPLLEGYVWEFVPNVSKKPGSHLYFGIDCPSLIVRLEGFNPDVILVFGWKFKSHLSVMRYFKGKVPIWFRGDSTLLDEAAGPKTILRRLLLKWVYTHVDKALYVGSAGKDYYLKHGIKENQLIFTPHAIDNERFTDNVIKQYEIKTKKWKKELGYNPEDIVVLFSGKFQSIKQPEVLLKAVVMANSNRLQPIHLLMVGNGPLESQLKEQAKNYNFIRFIPFQNQSNMPIVYRLGDIFCLPSKSETWGLSVNEAMACGRPVIVTNKVGCAQDLVAEGENGFIINHAGKDRLVGLLSDLTLPTLKIMGNRAQQTIQKWSFDSIAKGIEKSLV